MSADDLQHTHAADAVGELDAGGSSAVFDRSVQMTDRYDNPQLEAKLRALRPVSMQVIGFWN